MPVHNNRNISELTGFQRYHLVKDIAYKNLRNEAADMVPDLTDSQRMELHLW